MVFRSFTALCLACLPLCSSEESDLTLKVEGTLHSIRLVKVTVEGTPLWVAVHETPWELYDTLIFKFDQKDGKSDSSKADAVTRPTKPYVAADRGFGHNGFPAVSVSFSGAKSYCEWLSAKTGRTVRLPSQSERESIARQATVDPSTMTEFAVFADNAKAATQKVGSKKADALGLHDLFGNAGEWAVAADGTGVLMGGSFEEPIGDLEVTDARKPSADWNASDPQFPKSVWWLTDAPFAGFRIVIEDAP